MTLLVPARSAPSYTCVAYGMNLDNKLSIRSSSSSSPQVALRPPVDPTVAKPSVSAMSIALRRTTRLLPRIPLSCAAPSIHHRILSTKPSPSAHAPSPTAPAIVQYLGYGGAIPFVVGGLGSLLLPNGHVLAQATQLYGAAILSFLGGVHWGLALRAPSTLDFAYSVTPSLLAWGASLAPLPQGLAILSASFVGAWAWDEVRFRGASHVPPWYRTLRRPLTVAAAGGCALAWRAVRGTKKENGLPIKEADTRVLATAPREECTRKATPSGNRNDKVDGHVEDVTMVRQI
ncbi:unnamed protein product [Chondrus crispus]|uniref:DUF3429 domain-containing protein n=1 Tax=Chondrus crispus TaxID=2769 RepID=R7QBL9_CHOCR|nr:unnamed protein product [Chondrus crispus]CDF34821.1 unnamed protein product [Chondrus crispus]|eukprot:XP_005714640.1 unnamed protein product [Chondrus crispus]